MKRTNVPKKEFVLAEESNFQRLLDVIFLHPETEFSVTEIAKAAGIAKSAASRLLPKIRGAGIIVIKEAGIVYRVKANIEDFEYTKRKIAWNLKIIYGTTLIEYLDEHFHRPKAIVLFGSFRTGQDIMGSDIDVAIETTEEVSMTSARLPELRELELSLKRPIQLHIFHRKYIDENVFSNIANGIVLLGYLEVRK